MYSSVHTISGYTESAMQVRQWMAVCGITAGLTSAASAQEVPALVDKQLPGLVDDLPATPSHAGSSRTSKRKTSAWLADEFRNGRLHRHRPRRQIPRRLAGLWRRRNPEKRRRPTLLIRTDMDALPVDEEDRPALCEHGDDEERRRAGGLASCTPADTIFT